MTTVIAMAVLYYVYLNTMIFAIVSGVVSMILLLALIYVPTVSNYAILILTVQIGLIAIVIQALIRIWLNWRSRLTATDMATNNTLAVGFCPDYMIASANSASSGGGVMCTNAYAAVGTASPVPIWTGNSLTGSAPAPSTVDLSKLDGQPIATVCQAINDKKTIPTLLPNGSTSTVPWTDLRSRCTAFPSS